MKATVKFASGVNALRLGRIHQVFSERIQLAEHGARLLTGVSVVGSARTGRKYVMKQLCADYPDTRDAEMELRALVYPEANTVFLDGLVIGAEASGGKSALYASLAAAFSDVVILVVADLVSMRSSLEETRGRLRDGTVLIVVHNQRRYDAVPVDPEEKRVAAVAAAVNGRAYTRPGAPGQPDVCAVMCRSHLEHHVFLCDDPSGAGKNEGAMCAIASIITAKVPDTSFAASLSRALSTTVANAYEVFGDGRPDGDSFRVDEADKSFVEPAQSAGKGASDSGGKEGASFTSFVIERALGLGAPLQRVKVEWKVEVEDEAAPSGSDDDEQYDAANPRRVHVLRFAMRGLEDEGERARVKGQLVWGKGLTEEPGVTNPVRVRVAGPGTQLVDAVTMLELSDIGNEHAPVRVRFSASDADPQLTIVRVYFAGDV
eukprot:CAMPEP_0174851816 /NCGR_PEP_ID=MMETSP1114-20130205/24027_1 /TAXON_ID=312471 /ORGANISM="Neobodo designis, Strain CCAP 1951/1" /LENGTH=430 /DNA_ID=CAMNT_0016086373 /DNA_START=139 /DNA_END=1431 /DNA_ORIENTATION=+